MTTPAPAPRPLAQLRQAIRLHQYSPRTEEAYAGWVRRFVRFSGMRHPAELGAADVTRFPDRPGECRAGERLDPDPGAEHAALSERFRSKERWLVYSPARRRS